MATPYIYIITAPNNDCYVGQSAASAETSGFNTEYQRIYNHVEVTYLGKPSDQRKDASVPIFQAYPLKEVGITIHPKGAGGSFFDLPQQLYIDFLKYFEPTGAEKVQKFSQKGIKKGKKGQKHQPTEEELAKREESTIKKVRSENAFVIKNDKNNESYTVPIGLCLDIAEIVWMCRYQAMGYNILNKTIGGQRATWKFIGLSGEESVNINTSRPSEITSMLLSTEATDTEKNLLQQMQTEADKIIGDFLDEEIANLIVTKIKNDSESRKQLLSDKVEEISLKPIVERAISDILEGKWKASRGRVAQFKADMQAMITKYAGAGLTYFGFTTKWDAQYDVIIKEIAKMIASSLLSFTQNRKLKKDFSIESIKLNVVAGSIRFKGQGGKWIDKEDAPKMTINIDQVLRFDNKTTQHRSSWWYDSDNSQLSISTDTRWQWALHIFSVAFGRVKDKQKGIVALSKEQKWSKSDRILESKDHIAIIQQTFIKKKSDKKDGHFYEQEETLLGEMKYFYKSHLKWGNAIFKKFYTYFSRAYSILSSKDDKQKWRIVETYKHDYCAVLDDHNMTDPTSGITYVIGFPLWYKETFDTTTAENDYNGITF